MTVRFLLLESWNLVSSNPLRCYATTGRVKLDRHVSQSSARQLALCAQRDRQRDGKRSCGDSERQGERMREGLGLRRSPEAFTTVFEIVAHLWGTVWSLP